MRPAPGETPTPEFECIDTNDSYGWLYRVLDTTVSVGWPAYPLEDRAARRVGYEALGGDWDEAAYDRLLRDPHSLIYVANAAGITPTQSLTEQLAYKNFLYRNHQAGTVEHEHHQTDYANAENELRDGEVIAAMVAKVRGDCLHLCHLAIALGHPNRGILPRVIGDALRRKAQREFGLPSRVRVSDQCVTDVQTRIDGLTELLGIVR